jgi:ribose transport system ATP-binding protein
MSTPGTARAAGSSISAPSLRVAHLSKTFPGTVALDDVAMEVADGEIHALVGQNGSGKSTLIKVLAGYHRADRGSQAWINGEELSITGAAASHDRLRFVHQDLGLFVELSAVDNLALRGEFLTDAVGRVQWRKQASLTAELLGSFDLDLDLHRPLSEATPVQRTIVAIAAALAGWHGGPGLLVLDEPTAVLPPSDVSKLLAIVQEVRSRGTSILYVSHRLDEIFDVADRVTVLRGGRLVATMDVADTDPQGLARAMVGSDVDTAYRAGLQDRRDAPVVLEAKGLVGKFLGGVELELHQGEVLGIAGLPGSGRSELPYALAGALPGTTGQVRRGEQAWTSVSHVRDLEIPLVAADRAKESVFAEMSVRENLSVSVLGRLRRALAISRHRERRLVDDWVRDVKVKLASPDDLISTLSGGNQQKVMIARCLARDPEVLILCEPTAGVDVGARQGIYALLAERADQGLSLIVSSSDTGDLLALCTRVLVMCNGRVVRELHGDDVTEASLIKAMEEVEQQ